MRRPRGGRSSIPCSARAAIWHDGWKAITTHPTIAGWSHFNDDEWELYHTEVDRAEIHNLADEHPDKVRELASLWFSEAGANNAFPLDDRSALEIMMTPRPVLSPPRDRYVYYPGTAEVPESQAVNVRNRSYSIGAEVDIPAAGAAGVLFAHGSLFGGHALYVKDDRLHYVYNFVGMQRAEDRRQRGRADRREAAAVRVVRQGRRGSAARLHRDPVAVPRRQEGRGSADQDAAREVHDRRRGSCIGRDGGAGVTDDYPGEQPWRFTGGTIRRVAVDVSGEPYVDLEREAAAMMMKE